MTAGAQQPISAIAVGDSVVSPPSIGLLDSGRVVKTPPRCVGPIIKMAMNRTKQKPFHLSSCFSGLHNKNGHA